MKQLIAYWFGLNSRERIMVTVAAAVLVVFILYAMAWQPLTNKVAGLTRAVAEQNNTLDWMRRSADEIKQIKMSSRRGGGSLLTRVERTARIHKLGDALKRIDPAGTDNRVRLQLEQAGFDDLLRWIEVLASQHGIHVDVLTVDGLSGGRVNARLTLTGGGS